MFLEKLLSVTKYEKMNIYCPFYDMGNAKHWDFILRHGQ